MKLFIYSILFCFFSLGAKAQMTMHKLISTGYTYQNSSFADLGGKLLFLNNDNTIFRVGASALLGSVNNKFAIMPKIQGDFLFNFEKSLKRDFDHSFYYILGIDVTNKFIAPKAGLNIFGIVDITGGYGFSISNNGINGKELKGANINFTINLPIPLIYDLTH